MDAKNNDPNEPEQKKIPLTRGAYHLKENFGNSWWKVPWKSCLEKPLLAG